MFRSDIIYSKYLKAHLVGVLTVCLFLYSCKEKYIPTVNDINPNYIVIDGFINTGADSTIFKLSRTFKLESKAVVSPERAAIVTVESEAGPTYKLPELASKPSGRVSIASTATSTEDRLADNLIVDVLPSSPKIKFEYSVLVKQNVLTKAGFEFYETLRNNTEKVGSIFDAQPSVLFGNIKCTSNPQELVIGFISAGTVTQKRIIVLAKDVPFKYTGPLPDSVCIKKNQGFHPLSQSFKTLLLDPDKSEYTPIYIDDFGNVISTKFPECVYCALQGGSPIIPSYWIN